MNVYIVVEDVAVIYDSETNKIDDLPDSIYINLVKFSKNLQNFLKRRLRRRLGHFAPENSVTFQNFSAPSAPKMCHFSKKSPTPFWAVTPPIDP